LIAHTVTPAKAGVQKSLRRLDSRLRGNDAKGFDMMAKVLKLETLSTKQTTVVKRNSGVEIINTNKKTRKAFNRMGSRDVRLLYRTLNCRIFLHLHPLL